MTETEFLPALPEDWESTRTTLHRYAQAVGTVPRAHGIAHPKWWHVSLSVRPTGLTTDAVPLPDGGTLATRMDLRRHMTVVETSGGENRQLDMRAGMTGAEFGNALIDAVAGFGLDGPFATEKFDNDEPCSYDPEAASAFFAAAVNVSAVFERYRSELDPGRVGPVQLWPHGFDLSFEWYGTRMEPYGDEEQPAQINLGFYPGGDVYFYSNPWPFEGDALLRHDLPSGAEWHTEGWEGSIIPYARLQGDPDAGGKLLAFARAVHDLAAPTLEV